ncbi:MAG: enoyl-CoA hydratase-related protein [Ilumatobacteraceae bacterium]
MTGFHVELSGHTAVVTIDRPKANAIDAPTSKAMGDAFVDLDDDAAVRAIIVTGTGPKFFSAGWDLAAAEEFDSDYGIGGFGGFPELAHRCTPIIAAVNGMAVGGGFEIAMAADLIVAAEHAQFWLPEPAIGILPDAGAVKLPRLLPPHLARELLLTGRRMDAAEGRRWGLIANVVPAGELLNVAHELADAIAKSAPLSIAALLDIERRTMAMSTDEAMAALKSLASYRRAIDSDDAQEGQAAFTERRAPIWRGR